MRLQFFNGVESQAEARSRYHTLALSWHPDRGGNQETMQAINSEYARVKKISDRDLAVRAQKTTIRKQDRPSHHSTASTADHMQTTPTYTPPREADWPAFVAQNYPGRDPLYFTEADFWNDKCYEGW